VEKIREEFRDSGVHPAQLALKFALAHPAVSTVIPGIRNREQALQNTAVSSLPDLQEEMLVRLRKHAWNRAFWYGGK
jgi:aryl-alcohol dehydrogenase-like predicted oxidoreductase